MFLMRITCHIQIISHMQVQHTHMTDTAAADHATVDFVVTTLHRFFPSFDYRYYCGCFCAFWLSFHYSRL